MNFFGKKGIVRQHEAAFAKKLLTWKFENAGTPVPDEEMLQSMAEKIVADAHEIARKRGRNVLEILRSQINDIKSTLTDQKK